EAARKAEEERKAKEAKEQAQEEADRQIRQEHLRSLLDREKARLRALQEKEAAQRRLLMEKQELENKMRELQERAAMQERPPAVIGQFFPRNGPSPYVSLPEPQLVSPQLRPSSSSFHNPPQESFRQPLLGRAPSIMQNEPNCPNPPLVPFVAGSTMARDTRENDGPKPLFPKFIPVSEQMPIYKGLEDSQKAPRLKKKSASAETCVIARPSLCERKVDPYLSNAKIIQSRDQLVDFSECILVPLSLLHA
ncbi:unnamed protein product, partial [Strongylus vulgaris]